MSNQSKTIPEASECTQASDLTDTTPALSTEGKPFVTLAEPPKQTKYIDQLTWLRGIAALLVICSHVLRATEVSYGLADFASGSALLSFFDLGTFGVVCFFTLSGCTLYISNGRRLHANGIWAFYIKRVFRIWPAYLVSLLVFIGFGVFFEKQYGTPEGHWIEEQFLSTYGPLDLLSYIFLTFNITGPSGLFNNAYWSLPVEFQYYVIFPVLIIALRTFGPFGPICIGIATYAFSKIGLPFVDSLLVARLCFVFCGGVVLGSLFERWRLRIPASVAIVSLAICITSASLATNAKSLIDSLPFVPERWIILGLLSLVAVGVVLFSEIRLPGRLSGWLELTGQISYSLYLFHNVLIALGILVVIRFGIHDPSLRLFVVIGFGFAASYLVAWLSYRLVEVSGMNFGRQILSRKSRSGKKS